MAEVEGSPSDTGLACFVLMLKFLKVAADPDQLRHQLGQGNQAVSMQDMQRLAKVLGVKARSQKATVGKLAKLPLPAIGKARDGSFFLIGQAAEDKVLIQSAQSTKPQILPVEEFEALWSGDLLLMTTRESLAGQTRAFDVTWFIPALVKYRGLLGEVIASSLLIQILALITPIFFQVVIDKVLVHKGLTTLDVMIFGLLVVSAFEVIMGGLRTYIFSHTTNRVDVELGSRLFKHLLALPLSYFENRRVGDSVSRVRELENIREFLTSSSVTLLIDLLFTVVFLAVMYLYSPQLLVIVLISLPLYVAVSIAVTPALRARLDEKFKRGAENQAFLVESITGVETLKAMAVEPQMQSRWEKQLAGYVSTSFKANMLGNTGSQIVQFINKASMALILYFGAKMVISGDMTVGQLVAFNMLAGRVSSPVLRLAQMWQNFQQVRVSVQRLGDILNTPAEPDFAPGRTNPPQIEGKIDFESVTFRYRADGPEILRRINLNVKPGEVLGIVGPSGSGKSTLTKLVQRMYVPESGRVLVDGVDLAMVDPAWLRRQVGVVLQENVLFNRTVRDNIALSDPTLPMQSVMAAAKLSGAHEFILQLPEGYDTRVEERGANLSGGQRQRLAIARALITNPRILILDEATSALDAESEEIIRNNLRTIAQGRTVIIIAHRLSAVRQANRIITVERGEITEEGSHDQLLAMNGRYAELYKRQTSQPDENATAAVAVGGLAHV
ncbi:leukotoxin translocation ATP-binding protein LktB [Rhodobacteraceae bacterium KLH11]|nr:leukotoxin translocation ATP-binding protein LktB [Rhodobacteraceae bacterium KLH11]